MEEGEGWGGGEGRIGAFRGGNDLHVLVRQSWSLGRKLGKGREVFCTGFRMQREVWLEC